MCGICGIINFNQFPVREEPIAAMMSRMKHRGPDDDGIFLENEVGFGFVRLSILDLTQAGHQPMTDEYTRKVIVFNGEIYNYIELRDELRKKGHTFTTRTDTEVVLAAYNEWGEDCLNRFNGMWAFAIYDKVEKSIFMARDRFGIKPFYYYRDKEQFIFASDIPPILSALKTKLRPDNHTIYEYLLYNRTDQDESTFYEGVMKLQHGCTLWIKNNEITHKKWYNLQEQIKTPFQSPDEYKQLLTDSIGLQLRSDVPIGVCLSGGLDSSAIVSILLKDYQKNDLNTFSATFGSNFRDDESEYINEFTSSLNNMYFTTPDAQSFNNDLLSFIKAHSEPVPTTSPYAQFKVMQLAKGHVSVLLDGQGADEQMAGYHYFFGFYYKELLRNLKLQLLAKEAISYYNNHRSLYALKSMGYLLMPARIRENYKLNGKHYIKRDFINQYSRHNSVIDSLNDSKNLKASLINHFEYKLEHLLKWEDRNSMWFSIESRVPFLDHRLVEKTLALPSSSIIKNGNTKYIFREAMKGYLPEKIRTRQSKVGFITPDNEWFRTTAFQEFIVDLLNSREFGQNPYIEYKTAINLYQQHLTGKINISQNIWKWINISLWMKEYIY